MPYEISGPYPASDLFLLEPDRPVAGKPTFANLKAVRLPRYRGEPEALIGPGLYGLFLHGQLFYIGLCAGANGESFGDSVLNRWYKHLTYQTLRSPKIVFVASEMRRILQELEGEPSDCCARLLGGRNVDLATADPTEMPLIVPKYASCTFNKARFASRNWDVFRPGQEKQMLHDVSFVYGRILPETASLLGNAAGQERYNWVKNVWLRPRESKLIRTLKPCCNWQIQGDCESVTVDVFRTALAAVLDDSLKSFPQDLPAPPASTLVESLPSEPDPSVEVAELADAEMSDGEYRFRLKLRPEGEALVSELDQRCPSGLAVGFTDKPDLRIFLEPSHRVLVTLQSRLTGDLRCETLASVATCRALGLGAEPVTKAPMRAHFLFDPVRQNLSALFAVAGAAAQTLMSKPD